MKPEELLTEINNDIWDMTKQEQKEFHGAFVLNVFHSMQEVTRQDISKEFILKHFELAKNFNKVLSSDYFIKEKSKYRK